MANKFADLMDLSESRRHLDHFFRKFACSKPEPVAASGAVTASQRASDTPAAQARSPEAAGASAECCQSEFSCSTAAHSPPGSAGPAQSRGHVDAGRFEAASSDSAAAEAHQGNADARTDGAHVGTGCKHTLDAERAGVSGVHKARRLSCAAESAMCGRAGNVAAHDTCELCGEASRCECEVLFDEEDVCDEYDVSDDELAPRGGGALLPATAECK